MLNPKAVRREEKGPTVAEVLRRYGPEFLRLHGANVEFYQRRALEELSACRTEVLGGNAWRCGACQAVRYACRSCRNRHCPTCGGDAKSDWLERMIATQLPVRYAHMVFTLPHELSELVMANPRALYNLLFEAAWKAMSRAALKLEVKIGVTMTLHTWGQRMLPHVHVHCVVALGGLSLDGAQWIDCPDPHALVDSPTLADRFRRLYLKGLKRLHGEGELRLGGALAPLADEGTFSALVAPLENKRWIVHVETPPAHFADASNTLAYLARYARGAAIGDRRIASDDGQNVSFQYRDYRDAKRLKIETVSGVEFVRRFLLHVAPPRFLRIRHRGVFANARKNSDYVQACALLGVEPPLDEPAQGTAPLECDDDAFDGPQLAAPRCRECGEPEMIWIGEFEAAVDWIDRRHGRRRCAAGGVALSIPPSQPP